MPDERFARIRRLFEHALGLAPERRESYVRSETDGDDAMGAEVLELLAADDDGEPMPVLDQSPGTLWTGADFAGRTVAGFTVLRRIGSGGMGTVYEAQQHRPNRRVAWKTLAVAFPSERAQRRFEDEVDILARLRHPGIAQVLEVGTCREGGFERPWFAMELVEDPRPIDGYAREQQLDCAQKVALFRSVCEAVHFAHQRGVLHRDIKPANVLVDRHGQTKVIDFGIARLLDSPERHDHTRTGEMVGTLAYMSPERLERHGRADDVGADVYALGVLLYELLAGRPAFALEGVAPARAIDLLRAGDPTPPSRLGGGVARELDWITQKAMERDPKRRYATVADLIADLDRHRDGSPVLAGSPSTVYRLRKLAWRHRLALAMAATVFLASTVGLVVAAMGWSRVAAAERRTRHESETLAAVNRFQERILRGAYSEARGRDVRLADVVDAAAADLAAQAPSPPIEVALHNAIGTSYLGLGMLAEAEQHFLSGRRVADANGIAADDGIRIAIGNNLGICYEEQGRLELAAPELFSSLRARLDTLGEDHEETAIARNNLVSVLLKLGRNAEALPLAEAALATFERAHGDDDVSTITARSSLAMALAANNRLDEADAMFDRTLAAAQAHLHPDHPARLAVLNEHAAHQRQRGRIDEYTKEMQEVAAARERVLGPTHPRTLAALNNVAVGQQDKGDFAAAERTLRRIVQAREAAGIVTGYDVVITGQNLTAAIRRQGRTGEAEAHARGVLELAEKCLPPDHWLLGVVRKEHGACLRELGRLDEAEAALLSGERLLEAKVGPNDLRTQKAIAELVLLYEAWQRPQQAAEWSAKRDQR
ncbi:MAG TPA: tetratricopeptide repeat protein [Planctomycetota bacterium]|nr:tetratricopeptide repeat protein [Planctomycetota bacterium]